MRLRLRNYNMHQCIIIFAKGLLIISIILWQILYIKKKI
jgi:hypothetical protein